MTQIPALSFERSTQDRVFAGVCGGLASTLGVDATLVRFVFALLSLAGGAGILLYFALWVYAGGRRLWAFAVLAAFAAVVLLLALGVSGTVVVGVGLIVAGLVVVTIRGGSIRRGGSLPIPAIALMMAGALTVLGHIGTAQFIAPGAVAGALLLVLVPWSWQLAHDRLERIRLEERAEVAARIHDSVLQTLALVQRHADDAARVSSLARRQERELRRWLYGSGAGTALTLADALAEAAADVEELHGVRVELATAGDVPVDESLEQLVLAAREAMANSAKHSGASEVDVYLETGPDHVAVFVRDRGSGFERAAVPDDRRGLAESVEGRMRRAGGTATITSSPGTGTEVELTLPRVER